MNRIKPEQIHILGITVLKTNIIPTQKFLDARKEPENISVGFSQESKFDFDEGVVQMLINIHLIGKDEQDKDIGLEGDYSIEFVFKIESFKDFIIESKEIVEAKEISTKEVDGVLGGALLGIAFSTARGIILERTQGTPFQNSGVILPVINPNELL
ncbi:MAG: hypothetical protein QNK35_00660 [Bacteroides sp.]|nr:hypothetical protein [Bacteroides sp.]